jgi:RTX calcium-binding nonapeptide repeat (4 copies)
MPAVSVFQHSFSMEVNVRTAFRLFLPTLLVLGLASMGLPAGATHNADEHSANMQLVKTLPKTGVVNSDLAFWGNRVYAGYLSTGSPGTPTGTPGGFRIIDITNPENPTVVTDFVCWGSQNDVSVWNNDNDPAADLLFLSVDGPRTAGGGGLTPTCSDPASPAAGNDSNGWEGVRIFDINNETAPALIANVPTDCGSHTHTLVPTDDGVGAPAANTNLYIYVSSYPLGQAAVTTGLANGLRQNGTECLEPEPGETKQNGVHNKISIITVPLSAPETADDATGTPPNLTYANVKEVPLDGSTVWVNRSTPTRSFDFTACHDISVFVALDIASASCWAEAQFWDISDPLNPDYLRRIRNPQEVDTLFHSTTFTWDGSYVALEDEAGGGGDDRCRDPNDPQGRILFYNFSARKLGDFKIPRAQPKDEVCTAHLYNFVPQSNPRDILVSAWYEGGTSVADSTNPAQTKEIGFYDVKTAVPGGSTPITSDVWSSYWYNGYIYVNDEGRGLDIMKFNDARVEDAVTLPFLNPQTQIDLISQTAVKCGKRNANIFGTSEDDVLISDDLPDVIQALGGKDIVSSEGGNDRDCGGSGNDRIKGQGNSDRLFGDQGRDRLNGGLGNDRLVGGPGRDVCVGGPGKDRARQCEVEVGIEA